jgi:hypothetical protein
MVRRREAMRQTKAWYDGIAERCEATVDGRGELHPAARRVAAEQYRVAVESYERCVGDVRWLRQWLMRHPRLGRLLSMAEPPLRDSLTAVLAWEE